MDRLARLSEFTYYGLGGPYLDDFRLIYELCPEMKMVSIEQDNETCKRQYFHLPCKEDRLRLVEKPFNSFLASYTSNDEKSIFWLDYTGLSYGNFEDFIMLLGKVANSMVRVSLTAPNQTTFLTNRLNR